MNSRLFFEQAALALCSPQGAIFCLSWLVIGSLGKGIFKQRSSTRSWAFSVIICLDATKFVFSQCLYSCRDDFAKYYTSVIKSKMATTTSFHLPKICLHCRLMNKVHFWLTCIAQKRLCLSSLIYLQSEPDDLFQLLSIGLVRLKKLLPYFFRLTRQSIFF